MLTTKNQPHHRNEVSQNALFQNRMCFIYRKMTFLGQNLAENRKTLGISGFVASFFAWYCWFLITRDFGLQDKVKSQV